MPIKQCEAGLHFFNTDDYEEGCPICADEMEVNESNVAAKPKQESSKTQLIEDDILNEGQESSLPPEQIEGTASDKTDIYQDNANHGQKGTTPINQMQNPKNNIASSPKTHVITGDSDIAPPSTPQVNKTVRANWQDKTTPNFAGQKTHTLIDDENKGYDETVTLLPVTGWLVIVDGPGKGKDFRLIQGENRIGRNSNMEVCLDIGQNSDTSVSRDSHSIVIYDNNSNIFFIERGSSRNLPMVNGKTVRRDQDLNDKDIIQLGKTHLMFISFCGKSFKW